MRGNCEKKCLKRNITGTEEFEKRNELLDENNFLQGKSLRRQE